MGERDVAELEAQWEALVKEKGYICRYCGHAPCSSEREIFLRTNMFEPCAQATGGRIDWPPQMQHHREGLSEGIAGKPLSGTENKP